MLLVPGFESTVLLYGERPTSFRSRFFEEGGAIGKGGTNFRREVSASIWVVLFVGVWKVCTEAARMLVIGKRMDK
jgi:hypothetical protein